MLILLLKCIKTFGIIELQGHTLLNVFFYVIFRKLASAFRR